MADESAEKTEEPTGRRLQKAHEEGQVARSVELSTAALLMTATLFFTMAGSWLFNRLGALFISQLQFDRKITDKAELLPAIFAQSVGRQLPNTALQNRPRTKKVYRERNGPGDKPQWRGPIPQAQ